VAATNRSLREMANEGTFREDLFFRLNIIPMDLPPLRERTGDIPLLVGNAVRRCADELGKDIKGVTAGAMQVLQSYTFPGNVRELENIIERAVVLAEDSLITPDDLELNHGLSEVVTLDYTAVPQSVEELKETKRHLREQAVEDVEKSFVINALQRNKGNITHAAEETGMLRPNFQAMMKKLGIAARDYVES
jgi:transcriptional regulator with GAF, ATPase, and Fis domain